MENTANKTMNINQFVNELSNVIEPTCLNNALYSCYLATIGNDENKVNPDDLEKFKSEKKNDETVLIIKDDYKKFLIQRLLYRMGFYFKKDSTFEFISFHTIRHSNLELTLRIDGEIVNTSVIYAGGYIQTLHTRFLIKTKIKSSKESISYKIDEELAQIKRNNRAVKKSEAELKKVNRSIDKLIKEIEFFTNDTMLIGFNECLEAFTNGSPIVDLLEKYKIYGVKYGYSSFDYIKSKKQLINTQKWDYAVLMNDFDSYEKIMLEHFPNSKKDHTISVWNNRQQEYINFFKSMINEFSKIDEKKKELEKLQEEKNRIENLHEINESTLLNKLINGAI